MHSRAGPRRPSVLTDLDIYDAPCVNQHVAAIGGVAIDDLALLERGVRGVERLPHRELVKPSGIG